MPSYVILLRAVNVGGYGKLSMADFRKTLSDLGFKNVETYIQSGNAVADSNLAVEKVGPSIARALEKLTGAPVDVIIRTHDQLDKLIRANPFAVEAGITAMMIDICSFLIMMNYIARLKCHSKKIILQKLFLKN